MDLMDILIDLLGIFVPSTPSGPPHTGRRVAFTLFAICLAAPSGGYAAYRLLPNHNFILITLIALAAGIATLFLSLLLFSKTTWLED